MILRFPKGYDTPMGVAGGLLSGGQRQRIGLARAIYGKPLLVVLDEPNANLDEAGEAALVNAVRGMRQDGTTVVLITHRPGVVGLADQLLVMDQGRVQFWGLVTRYWWPCSVQTVGLHRLRIPGGEPSLLMPERLRVFRSCPLTTLKRTRSALQMRAIARAMAVLCALIGHVLVRCSGTPKNSQPLSAFEFCDF